MQKVIIYSVKVVGMNHYGSRSLNVEGYHAKHEPANDYDCNAIVITEIDSKRPVAYLQRQYAAVISMIFRAKHVNDQMLLKPKFEPTFKPRVGPSQRCNVGFYCKSIHLQDVQRILDNSSLQYKVMKIVKLISVHFWYIHMYKQHRFYIIIKYGLG